MSQSVAAKRYALALFELAQKNGQTGPIQEDLLELKKVFQSNKELGQLLDSPRLKAAKKKELMADLFKGANQLVLNTLFVMLDKKRMNEVVHLVDEFTVFTNDAAGIADAKVYSTHPLTADQSQAISAAFAHKIGKKALRIENIIDPNLIGGIRLQIGNIIYDSSVSAKLERLKRDLIGS
ncbi:F0F1 ATP synthase subunit delta [Sporosarcina sp. JAI121]|uniref:F0F1 ATP synthase subunit delta n=1 Tax=Sporosarcina sp. JAI121 TaxID=2723064 RepID=UPI0015C948D7|nr:F0F1 ATP synthase subunit delta [Sporosarcina sp. JAI121]NYF23499.1 F-type H+-transporting ATPase subunit delta [Sporosarcina sp. JAI121]